MELLAYVCLVLVYLVLLVLLKVHLLIALREI